MSKKLHHDVLFQSAAPIGSKHNTMARPFAEVKVLPCGALLACVFVCVAVLLWRACVCAARVLCTRVCLGEWFV